MRSKLSTPLPAVTRSPIVSFSAFCFPRSPVPEERHLTETRPPPNHLGGPVGGYPAVESSEVVENRGLCIRGAEQQTNRTRQKAEGRNETL